MNKVICGGFNVGRGLKANGKVLELLNRIPPVTDEDEGKVLGAKDGELAFIRIPLTFIAAEAGSTVKFTKNIGDSSKAIPLDINLEYSTDDGATWTNWSYDTPVTLANVGDKIMVCGDNPEGLGYSVGTTGLSVDNYNHFVMTGKIKAVGDVLSLLKRDMSITDISNTYYCFNRIFGLCTSLITPPSLGATVLGVRCYMNMFRGCSSLTSAPALPAKTLADYCYAQMLAQCPSLTTPPKLPATNLAVGCYYNMFYESGITTITELPATTLAKACYCGIFQRCHNLVDLGSFVLPATVPAEQCYESMFSACHNLVTPPEIMLTSLTKTCLRGFCGGSASIGSTQITSVKVHFTEWDTVNTGTNNATYGFIYKRDTITDGKFYCPASLPDVRDDGDHIPNSWEKVNI